MSPQRLTEILKKYRPSRARCAYLQTQLEMLERFLEKCQGEMITDQVTMSQAITGMPHGTTVGDPVSRLAIDIASGEVTPFVKQIQEEIRGVKAELDKIASEVHTVEIIMEALNDREQILLEMKMIDEYSWTEILSRMNREYNNSYSKRSLQRLLERAMEKAQDIVQ